MTPWKYFIMDDLGRTARIVNGVVEYLGQPAWLPQTPDGWQDISILWERNMTNYGNLRSVGLPFGFVMDGAKILRDGLYRNNVNKKLYLVIYRRVLELDDTYFRDYYKFFYKGQIALPTAEDNQGEYRFEANTIEGGIWQQLKAKESTVYTIPLDDDAVNLVNDGVDLHGRIAYLLPYLETAETGTTSTIIPMSEINREGSAPGAAWFDQQKEVDPDISTSQNFFLKTIQGGTYRIYGTIRVQSFSSVGIHGDIVLRPRQTIDIEIASYSIGTFGVIDVPINYAFIANPGWEYFLLNNMTVEGTGAGTVVESNLTIEYTSRFAPTNILCFKPMTMFKKLVEKITGNADLAISSTLENNNYLITSGDAIRGLPDPVIKTSLVDFFKAYDTYLMLGRGVENDKAIIENRAYFFQTDSPVDCGSAKEFKIMPASDMMFSRLIVGSKEQDIDDVNGRFAFNGQHHYSSPITEVSNEYEIISPYKTDPYEIENLRANLDGKETTDNSDDNQVFVIHGQQVSESTYQPDRTIPVSAGTPSNDSIYNLALTPARIVRVHGPWLRGILKGFEGEKLTFNSTNRNYDIIAGGIVERADINIDELSDPMFSPYYFDYGTQVPISVVESMETNPNQAFSGLWGLVPFVGHPLNIGIAPNTRQEQNFRLLAAADTDMTKFI